MGSSVDLRSSYELQSAGSESLDQPLLYHSNSVRQAPVTQPAQQPQTTTVDESFVCEEDTQQFHLIPRPSVNDVNEILSLLKVWHVPPQI